MTAAVVVWFDQMSKILSSQPAAYDMQLGVRDKVLFDFQQEDDQNPSLQNYI